MPTRLVNLVTVTVQPEIVERMRPVLMHNAAEARKEPGCQVFDVAIAQDDPNTYLFYEVYDDEAALAEHRTKPHFLAYWNLMQEIGDKAQRKAVLYTLIDP